MRTSADFLAAHSMLLRGEIRRGVQLADMFTVTLRNEGPTWCPLMIWVSRNGKTNKFNNVVYHYVARHRDVLKCAMSQVAFYLFRWWENEAPPTFQWRED